MNYKELMELDGKSMITAKMINAAAKVYLGSADNKKWKAIVKQMLEAAETEAPEAVRMLKVAVEALGQALVAIGDNAVKEAVEKEEANAAQIAYIIGIDTDGQLKSAFELIQKALNEIKGAIK